MEISCALLLARLQAFIFIDFTTRHYHAEVRLLPNFGSVNNDKSDHFRLSIFFAAFDMYCLARRD